MNSLPLFQVRVEPGWIDYNGHLRDAYYGLGMSYAVDAVMDDLGLDAAYRERTRCTLYTLELHVHYLHEVKESDALAIETSILAFDSKRIQAGCRFMTGGTAAPRTVATGEVMLLHVQQSDAPANVPFPAAVERTLASLRLSADAAAAWGPKSRTIALKPRKGP